MLIATEVSKVVGDVDELLKKNFNKQLFYPKQDDQIRLLRLKVWSERYEVTLYYILSKLIPRFEAIAKKHSGRAGKSKGLGTTISILTGPAAEEYLVACIAKEFLDDEHKTTWRQDRQQECIRLVTADEDDTPTRPPKRVIDFPTISAFRMAYEKRIKRNRREEDKLIRQLSKQPWRSNPFR